MQMPVVHVSLHCSDAVYSMLTVPILVNLRYDFKPAAIAFPTTVKEVSELVKLGEQTNHQVVARSGGVSVGNFH